MIEKPLLKVLALRLQERKLCVLLHTLLSACHRHHAPLSLQVAYNPLIDHILGDLFRTYEVKKRQYPRPLNLEVKKLKSHILPSALKTFILEWHLHRIIKKKLRWRPKVNFLAGLEKTFDWYRVNQKYYSNLNKKDILNRLGKKND